MAMYSFVIILLLAFSGLVFTDDDVDTTDWSVDFSAAKKPGRFGAARQIYGSSSLRTQGVNKEPKRRKNNIYHDAVTTRQPYIHDYDYHIDGHESDHFSHGVLITEPHPVPPPFDPSFRVMGGVRIPGTGLGIDSDVYGSRQMGERHGDVGEEWKPWDRYGDQGEHGHPIGIRPKHPIMDPDSKVMQMPDNDDRTVDDEDGEHQTEQPCTLACLSSEFLCSRSCMCIPKFTRCDDELNCEDGEDEEDCTMTNEEIIKAIKSECEASMHHVMCPKTFACIAEEFLCDGDDDCGDYTDETHCGARVNCSDDQFECSNGLCIQHPWVCDGDNDCKDYSDELNCTKLSCSSDEFQCADGNCVSASFRCDGEPDCMDDSDEANCQTPIPDCPEGEFKCKGFSSASGPPGNRCILLKFRCDGDNDCGDWSDEEGCQSLKSSSCSSNEFKCDDGTCIPSRWKCDMEQDCDGGEDEKSCTDSEKTAKRTCADDEFQCKDGRCILKTWKCDGIADCKRADDETNCPVQCEIGQFACPTYKNTTNARICVNQKHICDGQLDCLHGEDEKNCPTLKKCDSNAKCEQLCVTTSDGNDECACKVGFMLHENKLSCIDIDECQFALDPVCSQKCINTPGSFQCGCTNGYILRPDLRTCKALGGAVKLIMANRVDIRQVSLSNNRYTSIVKGLHNAIAIDFHYKRSLLFWSDVSTDVIKMSFMNGTGVRNIIKWGLESPGGIAVDWIHDLLFWTDSGTRRVEVATFDGALRAVVIASELDKPRAIVVHPGEALIFFTDWGNGISTSTGPNPKIERAYMDGSDRRTIIIDGVFWPNGLTIDYSAGRLYWADAKHHVIESSHFDGSDRKKILSNHLPHPFALTLFEDHLYWTDWNTKSISTANKVTGKGFRNVHIDLHFPMDIHSYHPSRQPSFLNRCTIDRRGLRGGCSHLCLPNKNSRRCGCPIGLTLKDDQKTCTDIPDKLLLIARKKDIRVRQLLSKNVLNEFDMVVPIDGLKSTIALDWCSRSDSIYWTDIGRSAISRAHLNGDNQTQIIHANLISPAGLALDWITEKLYWTDMGTNRIEVATTDGKLRAMLIWQGLVKPRDIVVNPIEGLMFWCDWGDVPLIEVAGMDGFNRKVLISKNIQWPNGLSIDHLDGRLYFVDSGTKTLESVNFDGSGRRTIIDEGLEHPFGIDIYDRKVYWTDWKTQSVEVADKVTGKNRRTIFANVTDLMDIRIFHRGRKSISNLCSISNGDCSHMCLLNPQGYKCACPIGVKLSNDGRTCNDGPTDYIIFAHRMDIRQISLDIDYLIDVVLSLPPMTATMAVDVDIVTGDIYWSDTAEDVIMKSTSDGVYFHKVIRESIASVDALVIDSVGRKVYFTDGGRLTVEVCELNGTHRDVLVWTDLEAPRGIAIDYSDGFLFWTDWGMQPKIERAYMDGERRIKVVEADLGWPNGITTDRHQKRIYWTDAKLKRIDSCDYDGNHRRSVIGNLPHPYGIAVTAHYVYWSDWKTMSLHVLDKQNVSSQRIIRDNLEGLMDVKVIEREEKFGENVCGQNNGNCSHLCLRNPKGFSCKCPTGTKLKSKTECENLPESYLLIALRSGIGRISLDTPDMFDVVLPINNVHGAVVVDYHYNQSKIFYADVNIDVIKSVDMIDMKDTKNIVSSGLFTPNGLAVDWVANNIFWSDTGSKVIEVARLDGSCRKVLIKDNLIDPRSVIVFPQRGYLYWADWGKPQHIERSYMDGSGRKIIVDINLGFPTGLSIDFSTRKLYWADALEDRIEVCDLDGRSRSQVVQHAAHPFGVTVFESNIYWTNWYNKSVLRAGKSGNHKIDEVRHGLSGALDIRSVSKNRQPNQWSPCINDNGGCTHLCLYKYSSYKCECPDKVDTRICKIDEFAVTTRPSDSHDYFEQSFDDTENFDSGYSNDNSSKARIVIIATAILGVLLILVVAAILFLVLNSRKKKDKRIPSISAGSVLTFSNPNYNGADGNMMSVEPKVTIWKRLKYEKAQERVYEEQCLGEGHRAIVHIKPSGQRPSTSFISPLSTIG